ncbi:unnamed protein product [Rotaria socialis]|uniref:Uncharacterized protein n=1 Tax=Rotaria socialis TaxID=392032 RepID=A0A817P0A9_9BILA|nr:unnamed protein product [Rotaria socialis]CAF4141801.1 unnamed protein product [Rotaria socialis]
MNSSLALSQNSSLESDHYEKNSQEQPKKKKGSATNFRNSLQITRKRSIVSRPRKASESDLNNLNPESQELILRTVDKIKRDDSEHVINVLDESRTIFRNSYEEFKREQDECRKQLKEISKLKATEQTSKENAISLSIFMHRKGETADVRWNMRLDSAVNPKYQAYFEELLSSNENDSQHPTDKAAVLKYIRRRERQKRAEENKKNHELSEDILEKQTAEIIEKMEVVDIKLQNEKQRQNELLRMRMQENKIKTHNRIQANEIIDQANEADLTRQRFENIQREKIEARLSAVRQRHSSINIIHVQSIANENNNEALNEKQVEATKKSLQLLNEHDEHRQMHAMASVYGNKYKNEKIPSIDI